MDPVLEKIKSFAHDQYSNENRLEARIQIYRYGEHETNFYQWIFNKLDFTDVKLVLEIGCGNGALWRENISKIPHDISITLTDVSEGMVNTASEAMVEKDNRFQFGIADASHTPFNDATFHMIIANHMLYHVDDKIGIFKEIDRLLSENGFAYASTLSVNNFRELMKLSMGFNEKLNYDNELIWSFNLENGEEVLSRYFNVVGNYIYQNDVIINRSQPLLLYLASVYEGKQLDSYIKKLAEFRTYIESIIKETGEIRITNKAVLFKFKSK
jgi:ubiquinone/menaquinone biosynthesis C-methylase UbiE